MAFRQNSIPQQPVALPYGSNFQQTTMMPQGSSSQRPTVIPQGSNFQQPRMPQGSSFQQPTVNQQGSSIQQPTINQQGSSFLQPTLNPQGSSFQQPTIIPQGSNFQQPAVNPQGLNLSQQSSGFRQASVMRPNAMPPSYQQAITYQHSQQPSYFQQQNIAPIQQRSSVNRQQNPVPQHPIQLPQYQTPNPISPASLPQAPAPQQVPAPRHTFQSNPSFQQPRMDIQQPDQTNQTLAPQNTQLPLYTQNQALPVARSPTAQSLNRRSISSIASTGSSQVSLAQTINGGSFSDTRLERTTFASYPICQNCKKNLFAHDNPYECLSCAASRQTALFCQKCFVTNITHIHDRSDFISDSDEVWLDTNLQSIGWEVRRTGGGRKWYHNKAANKKTFDTPILTNSPYSQPQPPTPVQPLLQQVQVQSRPQPPTLVQPLPQQVQVQSQPKFGIESPQLMAHLRLPPEWIELKDPDGRSYYRHRITHQRTWWRPTSGKLIEGWIEMKNPDGRPYYTHQDSQTTTWEHPGISNTADIIENEPIIMATSQASSTLEQPHHPQLSGAAATALVKETESAVNKVQATGNSLTTIKDTPNASPPISTGVVNKALEDPVGIGSDNGLVHLVRDDNNSNINTRAAVTASQTLAYVVGQVVTQSTNNASSGGSLDVSPGAIQDSGLDRNRGIYLDSVNQFSIQGDGGDGTALNSIDGANLGITENAIFHGVDKQAPVREEPMTPATIATKVEEAYQEVPVTSDTDISIGIQQHISVVKPVLVTNRSKEKVSSKPQQIADESQFNTPKLTGPSATRASSIQRLGHSSQPQYTSKSPTSSMASPSHNIEFTTPALQLTPVLADGMSRTNYKTLIQRVGGSAINNTDANLTNNQSWQLNTDDYHELNQNIDQNVDKKMNLSLETGLSQGTDMSIDQSTNQNAKQMNQSHEDEGGLVVPDNTVSGNQGDGTGIHGPNGQGHNSRFDEVYVEPGSGEVNKYHGNDDIGSKIMGSESYPHDELDMGERLDQNTKTDANESDQKAKYGMARHDDTGFTVEGAFDMGSNGSGFMPNSGLDNGQNDDRSNRRDSLKHGRASYESKTDLSTVGISMGVDSSQSAFNKDIIHPSAPLEPNNSTSTEEMAASTKTVIAAVASIEVPSLSATDSSKPSALTFSSLSGPLEYYEYYEPFEPTCDDLPPKIEQHDLEHDESTEPKLPAELADSTSNGLSSLRKGSPIELAAPESWSSPAKDSPSTPQDNKMSAIQLESSNQHVADSSLADGPLLQQAENSLGKTESSEDRGIIFSTQPAHFPQKSGGVSPIVFNDAPQQGENNLPTKSELYLTLFSPPRPEVVVPTTSERNTLAFNPQQAGMASGQVKPKHTVFRPQQQITHPQSDRQYTPFRPAEAPSTRNSTFLQFNIDSPPPTENISSEVGYGAASPTPTISSMSSAHQIIEASTLHDGGDATLVSTKEPDGYVMLTRENQGVRKRSLVPDYDGSGYGDDGFIL